MEKGEKGKVQEVVLSWCTVLNIPACDCLQKDRTPNGCCDCMITYLAFVQLGTAFEKSLSKSAEEDRLDVSNIHTVSEEGTRVVRNSENQTEGDDQRHWGR